MTEDREIEFVDEIPSNELAGFRMHILYSLRSPFRKASVRYADHGDYAQMFVSCGGIVQHTVGMMVDPARNGTFFLGYYSQDDFSEIRERYAEAELSEDYRQRFLDPSTYRGRKLHGLCEDLLVQVIRNGDMK